MGNCNLCGQPAGLFRSSHAECVSRKNDGVVRMVDLVKASILNGTSKNLPTTLRGIAHESYISETEISEYLVSGWEATVDHFLNDGALDKEEELSLLAFVDSFQLPQDTLDRKGAFARMAEAGVIRDVLQGKIPDRIKIDTPLPFNFQKSEKLIWVFKDVVYLEDRNKTEYKGRSQGISVRVMKGVYYRFGGNKGEAVTRTERLHVDTGLLAITTKHIYFSGPKKSMRIRHDKVVSLTPYSDGIAIVRDSITAKPQIFVTGNGWFIHNLLANVGQVTN